MLDDYHNSNRVFCLIIYLYFHHFIILFPLNHVENFNFVIEVLQQDEQAPKSESVTVHLIIILKKAQLSNDLK